MDKGVWRTSSVAGIEWRADNDPKGHNSTIICRILLPPLVEGKKHLKVDIQQKRLKVVYTMMTEPEVVVDSELSRQVIADESTWVIESDEMRKRYLSIHLAKKIDGENWPVLFAEEIKSGAPAAAPPKDGLTEKQRKAREASDLLVLQSRLKNMEPSAQAEVQKLLDQGIAPGDVIKAISNARRVASTKKRIYSS